MRDTVSRTCHQLQAEASRIRFTMSAAREERGSKVLSLVTRSVDCPFWFGCMRQHELASTVRHSTARGVHSHKF